MVIITVPMALVGVIVALIIRGLPSDLYTRDQGLVLMIALAAKNAILIVEFARELKAEGMSTTDAAVEATHRRLPADLDDFHRVHPGRRSALDCNRRRSRESAIPRHRSFRRHVRFSTLLAIPFVSVFYIVMEGFANGDKHGRESQPPTQKSRHPSPPTRPMQNLGFWLWYLTIRAKGSFMKKKVNFLQIEFQKRTSTSSTFGIHTISLSISIFRSRSALRSSLTLGSKLR